MPQRSSPSPPRVTMNSAPQSGQRYRFPVSVGMFTPSARAVTTSILSSCIRGPARRAGQTAYGFTVLMYVTRFWMSASLRLAVCRHAGIAVPGRPFAMVFA